jgi:hypothetical protein
MRQKNMFRGPVDCEIENDCAGEGQQQFRRQTDKVGQLRVASRWLTMSTEVEESSLLESAT